MVFPVVEASTTSLHGSDVSAHTVSLAGNTAGYKSVVIFVADGVDGASVNGGGWNTIFNGLGAVGNNNSPRVLIVERVMNGTEGATIQIDTDNPQESCHRAYLLSGAGAISITTEGQDGGNSEADPPSHDAGSAQDYLWICGFGRDDGRGTINGAQPANYSDANQFVSSTIGAGCLIGYGHRALNAQIEDPGIFDFGRDLEDVLAFTMAVAPAAAPGTPAIIRRRRTA